MRETLDLTGVVLYTQPVGEFDKRMVILTREMGKITAFARGARRQNSPHLAVTNPFVFATFHLYEGKNAYTFQSADVVEYFTDLSFIEPGVWYAFYFMELASYYGREGVESSSMVNLIYLTLRAVQKEIMPIHLIRRVYELRMMVENGDFMYPEEQGQLSGSAYYAITYCASCEMRRLYAFSLEENAEHEFVAYVKKQIRRGVDRPMKSLAVIDAVV